MIPREPDRSSRARAASARTPPARAALALAALAAVTSALASPARAASAPASGPGTRPVAAVIEGDILVGAGAARRAVDAGNGLVRRAIGVDGVGRRWPNGEVPYRLDPALGGAEAAVVRQAVARWNELAGVTIRAIGPDEAIPADHVVFEPGDGCASWVGRQGGAQSIWVGTSCTAGSVMHEIGHALGLEHEHTRADRDAHVRVLWENIVPGKRHNFDTAPPDARLLGDYDLGSIMHYGGWNFSVDGRATLEPIDPVAGARMGQRESPSAGDVAAIARLYESDLSLVVRTDSESAAREATLFVTNEHEQGAHALTLELTAPGLRPPRPEDTDGWSCEWRPSRASCALARLEGGAGSSLRFTFERALDPRVLHAVLGAKTPDADPSDNGGAVSADPALGAARDGTPTPAFADSETPGRAAGGSGGSAGGGAPWWLLCPLAFVALGRALCRPEGSGRADGVARGARRRDGGDAAKERQRAIGTPFSS